MEQNAADLPGRMISYEEADTVREMVRSTVESQLRWKNPRSFEEVDGEDLRFEEVDHNPSKEQVDLVALVELNTEAFDGKKYKVRVAHGAGQDRDCGPVAKFGKLEVRLELILDPSTSNDTHTIPQEVESAEA